MTEQTIHCVGIGGIGISSLARFFISRGKTVTGSDLSKSDTVRELEALGIQITIGHKKEHVKNPDLVVYSAAVQTDNPELLEAKRKNIPIKSYAEVLGVLTRQFTTLAVSGSHGKSTTTALLGLMLMKAKFDPTIIVGTKLRELDGSNFRAGKSNYLVLEADEWNKSFHNYTPKIVVLTNIDKEHLDTYKTFEGVKAGFKTYLNNISRDGVIIANYQDKAIREVVKGFPGKIIYFNKSASPTWKLGVPGRHNQLNAEAAWQAAKLVGVNKKDAIEVCKNYQGAWRRFEEIKPKHLKPKALIYSDYAHHPSEIRATLQGAREKFKHYKIVAIFQPHLSDRLNQLFNDFIHAFDEADSVILLPIYKVAGREHETGKTSLDLQKAFQKKEVEYAKDFKALLVLLKKHLTTPKTLVIGLSAGDLDAEMRNW